MCICWEGACSPGRRDKLRTACNQENQKGSKKAPAWRTPFCTTRPGLHRLRETLFFLFQSVSTKHVREALREG